MSCSVSGPSSPERSRRRLAAQQRQRGVVADPPARAGSRRRRAMALRIGRAVGRRAADQRGGIGRTFEFLPRRRTRWSSSMRTSLCVCPVVGSSTSPGESLVSCAGKRYVHSSDCLKTAGATRRVELEQADGLALADELVGRLRLEVEPRPELRLALAVVVEQQPGEQAPRGLLVVIVGGRGRQPVVRAARSARASSGSHFGPSYVSVIGGRRAARRSRRRTAARPRAASHRRARRSSEAVDAQSSSL